MSYNFERYRDGGTIELKIRVPDYVMDQYFTKDEIDRFTVNESKQIRRFTLPPQSNNFENGAFGLFAGWWKDNDAILLDRVKYSTLIAWIVVEVNKYIDYDIDAINKIKKEI